VRVSQEVFAIGHRQAAIRHVPTLGGGTDNLS
jgi:hypothetical protein